MPKAVRARAAERSESRRSSDQAGGRGLQIVACAPLRRDFNKGQNIPENSFDIHRSIGIIKNCLLFFQPAWEYLLFDNRMNQARTRLVSQFVSGVPEQIEFENTERFNSSFRSWRCKSSRS